MASDMISDSGDDCILVGELKDRSCADKESPHIISVPDSSDETEKVTSSSTSSENKVICDNISIKNDECPAPVQQGGTALQSTETLNISSSCHSKSPSELCI